MDKMLFEKYIAEMWEMKRRSTNPPEAVAAVSPVRPENDSNMTGEGSLQVRVTSVRGLYPIKNALVTVFTGDADSMTPIAQGTTDESGKSPIFTLSTPAFSLSESPNPTSRPFAYYNIRTVADGFTDTYNYSVAVFDSVTSLQNVNLIPVSSATPDNGPIVIDEYNQYEL